MTHLFLKTTRDEMGEISVKFCLRRFVHLEGGSHPSDKEFTVAFMVDQTMKKKKKFNLLVSKTKIRTERGILKTETFS